MVLLISFFCFLSNESSNRNVFISRQKRLSSSEKCKDGSKAVQYVRKQCGVDRKEASDELCSGMHNPLSQRGKRGKRQGSRKIHMSSS